MKYIYKQNNSVRICIIKAKIVNMPKENKCKLYGIRDKTLNHIISESSKLARNDYITRHDLVRNKDKKDFRMFEFLSEDCTEDMKKIG